MTPSPPTPYLLAMVIRIIRTIKMSQTSTASLQVLRCILPPATTPKRCEARENCKAPTFKALQDQVGGFQRPLYSKGIERVKEPWFLRGRSYPKASGALGVRSLEVRFVAARGPRGPAHRNGSLRQPR